MLLGESLSTNVSSAKSSSYSRVELMLLKKRADIPRRYTRLNALSAPPSPSVCALGPARLDGARAAVDGARH